MVETQDPNAEVSFGLVLVSTFAEALTALLMNGSIQAVIVVDEVWPLPRPRHMARAGVVVLSGADGVVMGRPRRGLGPARSGLGGVERAVISGRPKPRSGSRSAEPPNAATGRSSGRCLAVACPSACVCGGGG